MNGRYLAHAWGTALTGVVLLVTSCGGSDLPAATATTTSAWMVLNEDASMRLTNARCDRELECDDVGPGKRFTNRAACMNELGREPQALLRTEECPSGVDDRKFVACVSAVRQERCEYLLDSIERLSTCRRSELCPPRVHRR